MRNRAADARFPLKRPLILQEVSMRKTPLAALAAALAITLIGGAFAQSVPGAALPDAGDRTHDDSAGGSPRLERGPEGKIIAPPATGPAERGTREGAERPSDLTNPQQAPTGESVGSEALIRAMLEKQGYSNVQNIRKEGDAYIATATKGGESVDVRVDPQLGQIQEHGG
jgi:hypothetical protein